MQPLYLWALRRSFWVGCVLVWALLWMGAMSGCSSRKSDCFPCSPGVQRCSPDARFIEVCQSIAGTGCYELTLKGCTVGTVCAKTAAGAACTAAGGCSDACQVGTFGCQGNTLMECQKDATTGCSALVVSKVCGSNEQCNPSTGQCSSGTGPCVPKQQEFGKRCDGNAVYWFDDCGNKGALVEQCQTGQTCEQAACSGGPGPCVPKNPQQQKKCDGNAVYWFDDCGSKGALVVQCQAGETCNVDKCEGGSTGCQGKDECQASQTQCVGDVVQSCQKDATTGCLKWDAGTPCALGSVCKAGKCEQSTTPTGEIGSTCTSSADCQNGLCVTSWPGGYCAMQCPTGQCPAGSICGQFNSNQGAVRLCVKSCTQSSTCRSGYECAQGKACLPGNGGGCQSNNECAAGQVCQNGQCVAGTPGCQSDTQCPAGQKCQNGQCVPGTSGCQSDAQCAAGQKCQNGQCVTPPCRSNADCPAGQTCQNAICQSPGGNPGKPGVTETRTLTVGGQQQKYLLYVSKLYTGTAAAPVLLAFHGLGDSAANYINTSQWKPLADQYGFILGVLDKPASGGQNSGFWDAYSANSPDIAFADAVMQDVQKNHNTNAKKLYVVGFSQGGYFSFRYGMQRASTLAGFAVQAASNPGNAPAASRKIAVAFVIGTLDSAYSRAQQDSQTLKNAGHPVLFIPIQGAGHCCAAQNTKNAEVWQFLQQYSLP